VKTCENHIGTWVRTHNALEFDELAHFLGTLFACGVDVPLPFPVLSEPPSSMEDLWHALRRMKANRCDDDAGLVAELVQFSPNQILQNLFCLYNSHCSFFSIS